MMPADETKASEPRDERGLFQHWKRQCSVNQNTRGGFRKARSLSAIGIAAPSFQGGGRNSAEIYFNRRIRLSIRGVPETKRHGIEFGLLVAEVDEQSSWKCLGVVREKACSRLLVPSIRDLLRNLTLIVRWRWLMQR